MWLARRLLDIHPGLSGRDLLHLATCTHREVDELWSFDRVLTSAFGG